MLIIKMNTIYQHIQEITLSVVSSQTIIYEYTLHECVEREILFPVFLSCFVLVLHELKYLGED